jgi:hypothetical protein
MATPAPCGHLGAAASAFPPAQWKLADVLRLYGESYRQMHPVSVAQQKVMEAIMACAPPTLGATPSGVRSAALNATPITRAGTATVPSARR